MVKHAMYDPSSANRRDNRKCVTRFGNKNTRVFSIML